MFNFWKKNKTVKKSSIILYNDFFKICQWNGELASSNEQAESYLRKYKNCFYITHIFVWKNGHLGTAVVKEKHVLKFLHNCLVINNRELNWDIDSKQLTNEIPISGQIT